MKAETVAVLVVEQQQAVQETKAVTLLLRELLEETVSRILVGTLRVQAVVAVAVVSQAQEVKAQEVVVKEETERL
ncbi:MAG: hypothetical protein CML60_01550 [Rhodobacteraceae bacterium]|nr:hypothetical protein [Paracoccaceae bacterium]